MREADYGTQKDGGCVFEGFASEGDVVGFYTGWGWDGGVRGVLSGSVFGYG